MPKIQLLRGEIGTLRLLYMILSLLRTLAYRMCVFDLKAMFPATTQTF